MIQRIYPISIGIATALGWASWAVVVIKLSPFSNMPLSMGLFYPSLFMALAGTLTLLNVGLRAWGATGEMTPSNMTSALRQGCLLSLMVCLGLAFQRLRVLTWWDAFLLLAIVLLIEYYFMATE